MTLQPYFPRVLKVLVILAAFFGSLTACANAFPSAVQQTPTPPVTETVTEVVSPQPTFDINLLFPTPTMASSPVYTNPVYAGDFPDPFILRVDKTYYSYATNSGDVNIQLMRSTDLVNWEYIGDALERLPDWSDGQVWAPSVLPRGDKYLLFYTLNYRENGLQCVSLAISDKPEGPFKDISSAPFLCQTDLGGSIDASPFVDSDGKAYLLWKNNGNDFSVRVSIWVQTLSEDGLALTGEPVELIAKDQLWENPLVEGPSMVKDGNRYYLFYSANMYESPAYAIGYAVCETITGPCIKPQNKPFFSSSGNAVGPGGQEFFTDTLGNLWMAYHAWTNPKVGYPDGARSLRIDRVTFVSNIPVISQPAYDPVYAGDFPDPFILPVDDVYYAYASHSGNVNIQLLRSLDLKTWGPVADVLPLLPAWADGLPRAPSVLRRGNQYILYYTIRSKALDQECISGATSVNPEGPFQDNSTAPLLCQTGLGGSVNPSPFVDDDGQAFLLWNNDGGNQDKPNVIWIQPLSEDGMSLAGEPAALSIQTQPWEEPHIENPSIIKHGDKYYLFYSANQWDSLSYAIGYAICDSITGPCSKPQNNPFHSYFGKAMGPGGQDFFIDTAGALWITYHSWKFPYTGYPDGVRNMRVDRVTLVEMAPISNGPTTDPQPLP